MLYFKCYVFKSSLILITFLLFCNRQSEVYYKKKHRMLKVKLVDGTSKTVLIDDSSSIGEIAAVVCKKVQINNPEEYSLRVEGKNESMLTFP